MKNVRVIGAFVLTRVAVGVVISTQRLSLDSLSDTQIEEK